jgi:hypothetical protein
MVGGSKVFQEILAPHAITAGLVVFCRVQLVSLGADDPGATSPPT